MAWPRDGKPWVRMPVSLAPAVKAEMAVAPKRLMADCITMVPEAVMANCRPMGRPTPICFFVASWWKCQSSRSGTSMGNFFHI